MTGPFTSQVKGPNEWCAREGDGVHLVHVVGGEKGDVPS